MMSPDYGMELARESAVLEAEQARRQQQQQEIERAGQAVWNNMSIEERADCEREYARLQNEARGRGTFLPVTINDVTSELRGPFTTVEALQEGFRSWLEWKERTTNESLEAAGGIVVALRSSPSGYGIVAAINAANAIDVAEDIIRGVLNTSRVHQPRIDLSSELLQFASDDTSLIMDDTPKPESLVSSILNLAFWRPGRVDAVAILHERSFAESIDSTGLIRAYGYFSGQCKLVPHHARVERDREFHLQLSERSIT